jgi:hypothetical protein
MTYQFWRLSEAGPHNLGPTCTDNGLLLGRTPLIERHDGRFVVRDRDEIKQLLKKAYGGEPRIDRLMSGLATVASALNADDVCLARIAAVHLKIPDLPNQGARDALEAEDSLIKHALGKGGSADWNPALHPRTGMPPNPGWFAPTGGGGSFWSNVSSAVRDWLQQPVPEYDLETGQVVGNDHGGELSPLMWPFPLRPRRSWAERQRVYHRSCQVSTPAHLKVARKRLLKHEPSSPPSPKSKPTSA